MNIDDIIMKRLERISNWECCKPLKNDDLDGFHIVVNETDYMLLTSVFADTRYISVSIGETGILLFLINLETGGVIIETDKTLPGEEYSSHRNNLSDIRGALFNSEPLWFMNNQTIIDTTISQPREMSMSDIIGEILRPENLIPMDDE